MRKIVFGIVIALVLVFGLRYCEYKKDERELLEFNTSIIQEQLKNVGKLVVTEGNYAEVFSYADSKKFYFDMFSSDKKALVIVNAKASISYDLSEVKTKVDAENKTVVITNIPEPELSINPNIKYYDIEQDYLNQFKASDYNKIKKRIESSLRKKIEASELRLNAQNRLISELQKIYILTSSMGWQLEYNDKLISEQDDLNKIKL
ncbi:MAG: hypothetical protein ACI83B_001589 [Sediminicola sp.]|jgi:hypothetical protein